MKKLILSFLLLVPFLSNGQSTDPGHRDPAIDSLLQVATVYIEQQDFEEALPILMTAKKRAVDRFGTRHRLYADCLLQEGRLHYLQREWDQAETSYLQVQSIRKQTVGEEHLDYATVQYHLGLTNYRLGRYPEAEQFYLEAKAIRERELGKDNLDYADVLNQMAILNKRLDRLDEAEQMELEILAIREKLLGNDHPDYIKTLNNLGSTYYRSGYLDKAEDLWLQVKEWREKNQGKNHPDYLGTVSNLANLYTDMARYEAAERIYSEVKAVQEKELGTETEEYGFTMTYLGELCRLTGRYEEAERYLVKARNINKKVLGAEHPGYAASLDQLASLYHNLGLFDEAEALYLESKFIVEKQKGTDHPDYASILQNLATLYEDMKRQDEAEKHYLDAKVIFEKQGKEDPAYLWVLNNLAILYTGMEKYEKAEAYLKEVSKTREKVNGRDHPDYANVLEDLAVLYHKMANPEAALPMQKEALDIYERSLGKDHSRYIANQHFLAGLYTTLGEYEKAVPLYIEASEGRRNLLANASRHLSERELAAFAGLFERELDGLLASVDGMPSAGKLIEAGYDNTLFYKGFLLTTANRVRQLAKKNDSTRNDLETLSALHRRISEELTKPLAERNDMHKWQQEANELEKKLTGTVAGLGESIRQVSWKEVQKTLKPGEAAAEFIHFTRPEKGTFYGVLVVLPGYSSPVYVPLCEEASLDLLKKASSRRSDYVADLYNYEGRGASRVNEAQKSLVELLWKPLENVLKDVKTLYYAPTGVLHRLNLGAIGIDEESCLADQLQLVLLGSTRQLVLPHELLPSNQDAWMAGGIQYDLDSAAIAERQLPLDAWSSRGPDDLKVSSSTRESSQRTGSWTFISWTKKEVASIKPIVESGGLKAELHEGNLATEEAFKEINARNSSPRIIHLATHGYFFPDPDETANYANQTQEAVFKISDQPLVRSGLIMAGGNFAWVTGKTIGADLEDGILTAYEISQMDLSNTELVVLSACETGLGEIKGNEGVYGLQRAFKIAGVKYILMSLWEVPDDKTKRLMTNFYSKWIEDNMSIREALLAAQADMREIGFSPYDWAGFVLME